MDDATTTADSPATAARTCTIEAVCTPSTDTSPARRPWDPLRATMNSTAGPGITSRTIDAAMKTGSVESEGTVPTLRVSLGDLPRDCEPSTQLATQLARLSTTGDLLCVFDDVFQLAARIAMSAIASSRQANKSRRESTAPTTLVTPRCTVLS